MLQSDLPYQLDHDLKTHGQTKLNGAIDTDKQRFGAHYRIITEADGSRRLIGFNFQEQAQSGDVTIWEFDDSFNSISKIKHTMPVSGLCTFHIHDDDKIPDLGSLLCIACVLYSIYTCIVHEGYACIANPITTCLHDIRVVMHCTHA